MKKGKEEQMNGRRSSTKKDVGFMAVFTLMLTALKLLGIIRCGWLVVSAPLIGTGFAGIIIAAASISNFLWRCKDELHRNI